LIALVTETYDRRDFFSAGRAYDRLGAAGAMNAPLGIAHGDIVTE